MAGKHMPAENFMWRKDAKSLCRAGTGVSISVGELNVPST